MSLRALGGGELIGEKLVRFVYLDEGGISKPSDPHIVVAGVMVHADTQWKHVEQYLREMADDFCLPEEREGFYFHASELSWGNKEFRERHSDEKRLFFLRALCDIPRVFNLPVFMFPVDRKDIEGRFPEFNFDQINTQALLHAAVGCASHVERFMRRSLDSEVAMLVYEQNGKKSNLVRDSHNRFRGEEIKQFIEDKPDSLVIDFQRIIETAHFARKEDTSLLQIADVAVHVFTRRLRGANIDKRCYESLLSQLVIYPSAWKHEVDALPDSWDEISPQEPFQNFPYSNQPQADEQHQ